MILRSYKFRLYPNKEQERKLEEQLEICRWLYNRLLEEIDKARKEGKFSTPSLKKRGKQRKMITQKDTQGMIVKLKEECSRFEEGLFKSSANGELSVMEQYTSIIKIEKEWKEDRKIEI